MSLIRPIPIDAGPDIDEGLGSSIAIPVESMVLTLSGGTFPRATFACEDSPAGNYVASFDLEITAGNVRILALSGGQTDAVSSSGSHSLTLSASAAFNAIQPRGYSSAVATITNLRLDPV